MFGTIQIPLLSFDEWLDGTSYTMQRRAYLRKVWRSGMCVVPHVLKTQVKGFIKREKFWEYKNPRMICSRGDPFKCYSGPFFKSVEEVVFANPNFIKHIPVAARAKYVVEHFGDLAGKQVYVNDHTSFEVHAHSTFRELEFGVYRNLLPKEIVDNLETVLCGSQHIQFGCGHARVNSRMSGEMNTSLGNGLANILSFLAVVYLEYGNVWRECMCIIEGDDGIFVVPKWVVLTPEMFARAGFVVVLEPQESLGTAGFCSTYFLDDGSAAVVDPMKAIAGFGWSFTYRPSSSDARLSDLRVSKALSFFHEYRGVPMLHAVGDRLISHYGTTLTGDFIGDWYERQIMEWEATHRAEGDAVRYVAEESRALFQQIFGITIAEQISYEIHVAECSIAEVFDHPSVRSRIPQAHVDFFSAYAIQYEL